MTSLRLVSLLTLALCLALLDGCTASTTVDVTTPADITTVAQGTTDPDATGAQGTTDPDATGAPGQTNPDQTVGGGGGTNPSTVTSQPGGGVSLRSSLLTASLLFSLTCLFQLLY